MEWKAFQELIQMMIPRSHNGSFMIEYEDEQIKYTIGEKTCIHSHQDYDEAL